MSPPQQLEAFACRRPGDCHSPRLTPPAPDAAPPSTPLFSPRTMRVFQWLVPPFSLTGSFLGIAFTLDRWGITPTLWGVVPLALTLASLALVLIAVGGTAWLAHQWGVAPTLQALTPLLLAFLGGATILAAVVALTWTILAYGLASTLWTVTCVLVLLSLCMKATARLWAFLRPGSETRTAGSWDRRWRTILSPALKPGSPSTASRCTTHAN